MLWIRVDNRLVHGQVIETWLPYTNANHLLVVNDDLAADFMRQTIISLAVPSRIKLQFLKVEQIGAALASLPKDSNVLVLVADCHDAVRLLDSGVIFSTLNIGNLHYGPGKRQVCSHVALSEEDEECLLQLQARCVKLDFRCVPNEKVHLEEW